MNVSSFTDSQQTALTARGNVLVIAGAGTGKTHTLVERCCSLLLEEDCSLDEILMVTFTEAAAAEMRKRICARLLEQGAQSADTRVRQRLEEQVALLDTAYISTLHSFCLRLIREHFHDERLRLDPEFTVLTEEQLHQLRNQTLDALLESHYGGGSAEAAAFQALVTGQAGGAEGKVRELILRLHRYAQSLADPAGWFEKQAAMFAEAEPVQWRGWLKAGFQEWRLQWMPELEAFTGTQNVADCLKALADLSATPTLDQAGTALAQISEADEREWPHGHKGKVRDQIKDFFSEAAFLASLLSSSDGEDPLAEDWEWSRGHMQALVSLARQFGDLFDAAKREVGGVDFADLEQFALRLLWDARAASSTPLAREWQARLKFVFVDEYQDINEAQDTILRAVSREAVAAGVPPAVEPGVSPGGQNANTANRPPPPESRESLNSPGNRFLVGDVKQSIYRFRLADPKIFQGYKNLWKDNDCTGRTIPLSDNFRSREALLDFVNSFFSLFMREEIGGVTYDADARLKFGAPGKRTQFSRADNPSPQVEIHLRLKIKDDGTAERNGDAPSEESATDLLDLDATEKEARLVALQLKKLRREKFEVWDGEKKISRAAEWRDMVVLLRAPGSKAEIYAREFNRAGVPLRAKRSGFYGATEVSDLLSLLQLLDNPMQDLPLVAVLRSPFVGLSLDELAVVRACHRDDRFWAALLQFSAAPRNTMSGLAGDIAALVRPKIKTFLTSFDLWRRRARQGVLSDCVRAILDETHYESLVLAHERGEERLANLNRLLRLMRQFDPYQRQGLLRFLRFVESQRDAEAEEEPASPASEDAVQLLSIHQSKGLEFPIVAVADLGKSFNLSDLHSDILLSGEFGLCPRIVPPKVNARYPSLPYWLARRRERNELAGEELRLLYVAMTRARDRLVLVGSVSGKQWETRWQEAGEVDTMAILRARSCADWLAVWFAKNCATNGGAGGETPLCRWSIHDDTSLVDVVTTPEKDNNGAAVQLSEDEADQLRDRLSRSYPFASATTEPAKTSVTALRRRAMEVSEDEEAVPLFRAFSPKSPVRKRRSVPAPGKSAADVGNAYHRFLEQVSFDCVGDLKGIRAEAERMKREGILSPAEIELLDFGPLLAFWQSEFGKKILANAKAVRRELPFTARFSRSELPPAGNQDIPVLMEESAENSPKKSRIEPPNEEYPATSSPSPPRSGGEGRGEVAHRVPGEEFVIVQGVADLAVILPKEIWLVDFKTDDVSGSALREKTKIYEPQLRLYAQALQRIYGRPVTDCRIHFLSPGTTIPVKV